MLGPLTDNGGPTWTHALNTASIARNWIPYGYNGCGTTTLTDQRGLTRSLSVPCDIGAYELLGDTACYVETTGDSTTDFGSVDATALQTAVLNATPGATLKIAGTCAGVLPTGGLDQTVNINQSLTLRGGYTTTNWTTSNPATYPTVLDAQNNGRVIYIPNNNYRVTLDGLTIQNGSTTGDGGGIWTSDTLTVTNSVIRDNFAKNRGGGIYFGSGSMGYIDHTTIASNTLLTTSGTYFGAGLYSRVSTITIADSAIYSNTGRGGGGIFSYRDVMTISNSAIYGNEGTGQAGGINNQEGTVYLLNSTVSQNHSPNGAGIFSFSSNTTLSTTLVLSHTTLANNSGNHGIRTFDNAGGTPVLTILYGSIIADNGNTECNITGSAAQVDASRGYNLDSDGSCVTDGVDNNSTADPLLLTLADNGGNTPTQALSPASPARNTVPFGLNGCGLNGDSDQRGVARANESGCDSGAYEYEGYAPTAIDDSLSTPEDTPLTQAAPGVLGNATNADSDTLYASLSNSVSHGSLALGNRGGLTYTPMLNFNGTDIFTYTVADGGLPVVGHWLFNEGSGSSTYDAGDNALNGTLVGDAAFTSTIPSGLNFANAYALNLDGAGDRVNIPDANDINLTAHSQRTVSAWFRADDVSVNSRKQIIWEEGGQNTGLNIYLYNGSLYAGGWVDGYSWSGTWLNSSGITSGQWHHVALVLNSTSTNGTTSDSLFLYLDGTLVQSGSAAQLDAHTADSGIGDVNEHTRFHDSGNYASSGGHGFAGQIDDVRVMNLAATADEVNTLMVAWPGYSGGTGVATLTVTPVNDAPVATDDSYTLDEDTTQSGNVISDDTGNGPDSDPENDALSVTLDTDVSHGTLSLAAGGAFVYTPTSNFNGSDSFTYILTDDGSGNLTDTATVTFTVTSVNDAPVATDDSYTLDEDASVSGNVISDDTGNGVDSDLENDALSASVETDVSHGALTLEADGNFYYTPTLNFNGTDIFTYTLTDDGSGNLTDTATVTLTVLSDLELTASEPAHQLLNVSPSLPITLTFDALVNPSTVSTQTIGLHGSMSGYSWDYGVSGTTLVITPTTAYYPGEVMRLSVSNDLQNQGGGGAVPEQIQFTAATAAPEACAPEFVAVETDFPSVAASVSAWGDYDNDGDLDLALTGQVDDSTGFAGLYRNDGGTFVSVALSLPAVYNSDVTWADYDGDGDLDLLLSGRLGSTIYNTHLYRNDGGDTFVEVSVGLPGLRYAATDWGDYDNDGDLDLLVSGVGESPIGITSRIYRNDGGTFTDIGAGLTGVYQGSVAWGDYDNDGDLDLVLTGQSGATGFTGLYRNDGGAFTKITAGLTDVYLSDVAWGDYDNDGDLDILLSGMKNDDVTPTTELYRNDGGTFTEVQANLTNLMGGNASWGDYDNDGDLDILLTGVAGTSPGVRTRLYLNDGGTFTEFSTDLVNVYWGRFDGGDYDGDGDLDILLSGSTGEAHFTELYRNDPGCRLTDDSYVTVINQSLTNTASTGILSNDAIGPYTITLETPPTNGTLDLALDGGFVYTPTTDFTGVDSFVYELNGWVEPLTATATITVTPLSGLAVDDDGYSTAEETPLQVAVPGVLGNDADNPTTIAVESGPSQGAVTLSGDGSFIYTPTLDFNGTDTFTYRATLVSDGGISDTAVVSITVTPINDAPVAAGDSYTTTQNIALTVTAPGVLDNDSDVDGDNLSALLQSGPLSGTLILSTDGSFVYTPTTDFFGSDSFSYVVQDEGAVVPVAYWPFDEGSGTAVADVSGNSIDGTLNNAIFTTDVPITPTFDNPYALSFNGNNRVSIPDDNKINTGNYSQRAVALWFKADDVSINDHKQILWEEGGGTNGLNIYLFDGALYAGAWVNGNGWPGEWLTTTQISNGVWHHVVLSLNSSSTSGPTADGLHLYLDGQLVQSGSAAQLAAHSADSAIGNMRDATRFHDSDTSGVSGNYGHGFAGLIDDVRVMNVAVDASDAGTMMTDLPRLEDTATVSLTVEPTPTCFVSVNNSGITNYASASAAALQAAVNAASDGDLLRIAGACTGVTQSAGISQTVYISQNLTLQGGYNSDDWAEAPNPEGYETVLDAGQLGRVVVIPSGWAVTLDGLVIKNGSVTGSGSGIQNAGTLTVTNSAIVDNTATGLGGGINNESDDLILIDTILRGNSAGSGGGVANYVGELTLIRATVSSNEATSNGGGVNNLAGSLNLIDSLLEHNQAATNGGGLFGSGTYQAVISNTTFYSNTATGDGGGFYANQTVVMTNSLLIENFSGDQGGAGYLPGEAKVSLYASQALSNSATAEGGGLYLANGAILTSTVGTFGGNGSGNRGGGLFIGGLQAQVLLDETVIDGNSAAVGGGGIGLDRANITILGGQIISNTSGGNGGGLFHYDAGQTVLSGTLVSHNVANGSGGGIGANPGGSNNPGDIQLVLTNITLNHNQADTDGGGLWAVNRPWADLTNSTVFSNTAGDQGGGIYSGSTLTVTNTSLNQNVATNDGGGVYVTNGQVQMDDARILSNQAGNTGGAIYQASTTDGITVTNSCIVFNRDTAVHHAGGPTLSAAGNWWGATDGPSGDDAPGHGDSINDVLNIDATGWLTIAPAGCPTYTPSLTLSGGDNQAAEINQTFSQALFVTLTTVESGHPIVSRVITFTGPSSGAGITPTVLTATTDSSGVATTSITANGELGAYEVSATAGLAAEPITFTLRNYTFYTMTTAVTGNGSGNVTGGGVYTNGAVVTLTATANTGSRFGGWTGDATGTTNPLTVTLGSDQSITATFDLLTHTLTVIEAGSGSGAVTVTPNQSSYNYGTVVTLTATANTGSRFGGWSGGVCTGTGVCTITITGNTTVTASFSLDTTPPSTPTLLDPANGSVISTTLRPTFTWTAVTDGETSVVSYTLVITGSSGVQTIPITDLTYTPTDALDFGFYTWTVQAHGVAGNVSGYALPPFTFTIETAGSKVYLPIVVRNK